MEVVFSAEGANMKCCTLTAIIPLLLASLFTSGRAFAGDRQLPGDGPGIQSRISALQIPFIENQGQAPEPVRYYARTPGGAIFVTRDRSMVYSLSSPGDGLLSPAQSTFSELIVGGRDTCVEGKNESKAVISHLKGRDTSKWRAGLPAFASVHFGEIYEGIHLDLVARGNNVEKLFHITPGADPERILMRIEGAERLAVNAQGELEVETPAGIARFTKPVGYQEKDGARELVEVAYTVNELSYGFKCATYDPTREFVIDPLLASTFLGGSDYESLIAMALDKAGNVYVAGRTLSPDYPITGDAYSGTFVDRYDVVVSKFDAGLSNLLASTFLGGNDEDQVFAMATDDSGNVYLAGDTASSDFPTTAGAYDGDIGSWGNWEAFISKLDPNLTNLLASTFLGGLNSDEATAIRVDNSTNVYVVGKTWSAGFPTTGNAFMRTFSGFGYWTNYTVEARLKIADGNFQLALNWSDIGYYSVNFWDDGQIQIARYTENTGDWQELASTNDVGLTPDTWHDIRVEQADSTITVYLSDVEVLSFHDTGEPAIPGGDIYISTWADSESAWTSEVYVDWIFVGNEHGGFWGDDFEDADISDWSLWGADTPVPSGWSLHDEGGNYVLMGEGSSWACPGAYQFWSDGFVSKLDGNLTNLLASTFMGGIDADEPYSLALNAESNVYVCGSTCSPDFPVANDGYDRSINGDWMTYDTSFRLGIITGSVHVIIRRSDLGRYFVGFSENRVTVTKESPWGVFYDLADVSPALSTAAWHNVRISSAESGIEVFLGDAKVASVADSDRRVIGSIALEVLGSAGDNWNSEVYFDDIVVSNQQEVLWSDDFESGDIWSWNIGDPEGDSPEPAGWARVIDGTNGILQGQGHVWASPPWSYESPQDCFVTRFDCNLETLLGSTFLGAAGNENACALVVDTNGNVYAGGWTESRLFPTTPEAYSTEFQEWGWIVGFISKFNPGLADLQASTMFGYGGESIAAMALDTKGNVYVAGMTLWGGIPTTFEAYDRSFNSSGDGFIAKLAGDLASLQASTYLGGNDGDEVKALCVSTNGTVYAAGDTSSWDFPVTNGYAADNAGNGDSFISKFDSDLSRTPQPVIQVSTSLYNFGYIYLETAVTQVFEIVNIGRIALDIGTIALVDSGDLVHFAITNDNCSGQTIAPGSAETGTVSVVFKPTSLFGKAVILIIPSNDPDSPTNCVFVYGSGRDTGTAELRFHEGLAYLAAYKNEPHYTNDILNANRKFQDALAADPDHYGACTFGAVTRILCVPYDDSLSDLLTAFGMSTNNRCLLDWMAEMPETLPTNCPTMGEALAVATGTLLPAVDDSLAYLGHIPTNWTGSIIFSPAELPIDSEVQVDSGDIRMFQYYLELLKAVLHLARAHNFDFDFKHIDHLDTPVATITVDGDPGDWAGIDPLLYDDEGDSLGSTNADIRRVYTAMDALNAYVMVETYADIHTSATVEVNFNYQPGRQYDFGDYDDLNVNCGVDSLSAWTNGFIPYPIAGAVVARGTVLEASIPLSELGNPDYFAATFVNIWSTEAPYGDDPSEIALGLADYLAAYPEFGTITNVPDFCVASNSFVRAIDFYLAGSASIRAETDYQTDDLIIFDPDTLTDEQGFQSLLTQLKDSIRGNAPGPFTAKIGQLLNLGYFFSDPFAMRSLLAGEELQGILKKHAMYQIDWAMNHMSGAGEGFNEVLTPGESFVSEETEVDYGDVAFARAQLSAWKSAIAAAAAYDIDADLLDIMTAKPFLIDVFCGDYPQVLTVTNASYMPIADDAMADAIDYYLAASDFVRAEVDPQTNDLFTIDAEELADEADYRSLLQDMRSSMSGIVLFDYTNFYDYVYLGRLFVPPYVTRAHLPEFTNVNDIIVGTFPDPTFNGVLPYMTQLYLAERFELFTPDEDSDGLPDVWEETYFLSYALYDGSDDPDHDGFDNEHELWAGTNPMDPYSVLKMHLFNAQAGSFKIQWHSEPYKVYQLGKSTNLVQGFEIIQDAIPADPPVNTYIDAQTGGKSQYYRVKVRPR